jgi:hypothetical protein
MLLLEAVRVLEAHRHEHSLSMSRVSEVRFLPGAPIPTVVEELARGRRAESKVRSRIPISATNGLNDGLSLRQSAFLQGVLHFPAQSTSRRG